MTSAWRGFFADWKIPSPACQGPSYLATHAPTFSSCPRPADSSQVQHRYKLKPFSNTRLTRFWYSASNRRPFRTKLTALLFQHADCYSNGRSWKQLKLDFELKTKCVIIRATYAGLHRRERSPLRPGDDRAGIVRLLQTKPHVTDYTTSCRLKLALRKMALDSVVPKLFCDADPFNTGISFTHRPSRCGKRTSIDCRYKLGTFESIQNWRWCNKAFVCWNNVIRTFKFQLNCVMSFVVLYSCNWLCIIYFVWTVRQEMPHGQVLGRSPVFGDHCFDSMQFAKAKKFPLPIGNCC